MIAFRMHILMVLAGLLILTVTGCVNTATMFRGNQVTKVPVVTLQEGTPVAGTWQTFEFTLDYNYTRHNGMLELSGTCKAGPSYQMNFGSLSQLIMYFFFVDKDARVLETAIIISGGDYDVDESIPWSLPSPLPIPSGATGFSFGYQGSATDHLEVTHFYELPLSK